MFFFIKLLLSSLPVKQASVGLLQTAFWTYFRAKYILLEEFLSLNLFLHPLLFISHLWVWLQGYQTHNENSHSQQPPGTGNKHFFLPGAGIDLQQINKYLLCLARNFLLRSRCNDDISHLPPLSFTFSNIILL